MDDAHGLVALDSLAVDVLTDNVSDTYVSKTPFAVSEFSNIVQAGATVIAGETLLVANLGYGLRLRSRVGRVTHTLLFDVGTEGSAFLRNCRNLGIDLSEVEESAWNDAEGGRSRRGRRVHLGELSE